MASHAEKTTHALQPIDMSDEKNSSRPEGTSSFGTFNSLHVHRLGLFILYSTATFTAILVLQLPGAQNDLIALLSAGAIFATFGSAISTIGSVWERELLERVRLNMDILYKDLLKDDDPWRRWPFLRRSGKMRLLDDSIFSGTLKNAEVPLNVGTHIIRSAIPTVFEDFFDLPLLRNFRQLAKFRAAAGTYYSNTREVDDSDEAKEASFNQFMTYECLYDTWRCVLSFRVARYATHFGVGLTVSGTIVTAFLIAIKGA